MPAPASSEDIAFWCALLDEQERSHEARTAAASSTRRPVSALTTLALVFAVGAALAAVCAAAGDAIAAHTPPAVLEEVR